MDFPNPYEHKHYKWLMAVPLVLMAISLFFVLVSPGIPRGIDLKGGTLITLQTTDSQVNVEQLKATLSKYSASVDVRQVSTLSGTGLEIELESSTALEQASDKLETILSLDRKLSEVEVLLGSAAANNQSTASYQQEADTLKASLASELNSLYKLIGSTTVADASGELHSQVEASQQEFADSRQKQRDAILADITAMVKVDAYSFKEIGSSLSKFFLAKTQEVVIYSLILVAIVMFLIFRSLLASFAVIFGAIAITVITAGAMALLSIPLTLATVASLLMLIGFSLDMEVLLHTRLAKAKESDAPQLTFEAMKTGFLMNLATIGAFGALLAIAIWLQIPTYSQIGAVVAVGGIVDFIVTWLFNAPLLLWQENKKAKQFQ